MLRNHATSSLSSILLVIFCSKVSVAAITRDDFPRGKLIERVVCLERPGQSYALYLPTIYSSQTPRPILYCFDPGGRGRVPVELFEAPAEKLGYIVVGSNNSRNGPWGPIQEAIQAIWEDTHARFALDPRRFYAAGMSGGGGPAWALAGSGAAGTIICASVMDDKEEILKKVSFAVFCTAGLADFNYPYLDHETEALLKLRKPTRFEAFEGGHGWPPATLASEALLWMELQAMKSGLKTRNEAFVNAEWQRRKRLAENLEAEGRLWEAWMAWRYLALDFAGLCDTTGSETKASELSQVKKVRERRKELVEIAQAERVREGELMRWRAAVERPQAAALDQRSGRQEDLVGRAEGELRSAISQLKKQAGRAAYDRGRILSQRVLDGFYIGTFYYARDLLERKDYGPASAVLEVCLEIRPENASTLFDLARAYAGQKDRKKALSRLEKAVSAGFKDADRVRRTPEFDALRTDPRFQQLLSKLGGDSVQ